MALNIEATRKKIADRFAALRAEEAELNAAIEAEHTAEYRAALGVVRARIEAERGRHLDALRAATNAVQTAVAALIAAEANHNADIQSWQQELGKLRVPAHDTGASIPSPKFAGMGTSGRSVVVDMVHAHGLHPGELLKLAVEAGDNEAHGRPVRDPAALIDALVKTVTRPDENRFFVLEGGNVIELGPEAAANPNYTRQVTSEITGQQYDELRWGLAVVKERDGQEVVPA